MHALQTLFYNAKRHLIYIIPKLMFQKEIRKKIHVHILPPATCNSKASGTAT